MTQLSLKRFTFANLLSVEPIIDSYPFTDLTLARVYGRPEAQNLPVFWPPHHLFWEGDMIGYKIAFATNRLNS